jgi:hypothetical protein
MTLLITYLLLYQLKLHWSLYIVAFFVWGARSLLLWQNHNQVASAYRDEFRRDLLRVRQEILSESHDGG